MTPPLAFLLFRPQHTGLLIRVAQAVQLQQRSSPPPSAAAAVAAADRFGRPAAAVAAPAAAPAAPAGAAPAAGRSFATFTFRGNRAARQQQEEEARRKRKRGGGGSDASSPSSSPSSSSCASRTEAAARDLRRRAAPLSALAPPLALLPFAVTAREAAAAFDAEQARRCLGLHESGVLDEALEAYERGETGGDGEGGGGRAGAAPPDPEGASSGNADGRGGGGAGGDTAPPTPLNRLEPLLVPFWAFRATVSADVVAATLGQREDPDDPGSPVVWRERVFDRAAAEEDELGQAAAAAGGGGGGGMRGADAAAVSPELERAARVAERRVIPWSAPAMQVCASLELRRDLAEGAKPLWAVDEAEAAEAAAAAAAVAGGGRGAAAAAAAAAGRDDGPRPLSPEEAAALRVPLSGRRADGGASARVLPPDLRQSVAWVLALRALRHDLEAEAALRLSRAAAAGGGGGGGHAGGGDDATSAGGPKHSHPSPSSAPLVRDVRLRLAVHSTQARLALAPAWRAAYSHGEAHTPGRGELVPQAFEALVSALRLGLPPPPPAAAAAAPPASSPPSSSSSSSSSSSGSSSAPPFSSVCLERMFLREAGAALGPAREGGDGAAGPYSAEAASAAAGAAPWLSSAPAASASSAASAATRRGVGTPPPLAAVSPYAFGLRPALGPGAAASPHLLALPPFSQSAARARARARASGARPPPPPPPPPPRVVAEMHPSAAKARAAAAAVAGGAALAAAAAGQALGLWACGPAGGLEAWGLVDAAFFAFLAAAAAHTAARRVPQLARNGYARAQADAERLFHRAYDRRQTELLLRRAAGAGAAPPGADGHGAAAASAAAGGGDDRAGAPPSAAAAAAAAAALHTGAPDTLMLWLWADEDWRKWEAEAPWEWRPEERGPWADECRREQWRREGERRSALRRAAEAARALEKARRLGFSAAFEGDPRWQDAGGERGAWEDEDSPAFGGGGGEGPRQPHHHTHRAGHFSHGHGRSPPRRRVRGDFLGYYRLLGLDPAALSASASASWSGGGHGGGRGGHGGGGRGGHGGGGGGGSTPPEAVAVLIRAAYARAALRIHPDTAVGPSAAAGGGGGGGLGGGGAGGATAAAEAAAAAQAAADEDERRRAAERFRRLQVAYETLRDPERRAAYDRGQLLSAGGPS